MTTRPPTEGQLSTDLPGPVVFITGHGADERAKVLSQQPAVWGNYHDNKLSMAVAWTTSTFPTDVTDDKDVLAHKQRVAAGPMGLVAAGGTVLRYVDFAPGYECMMHRTESVSLPSHETQHRESLIRALRSVDFGIVLEGEVLSVLDSGEQSLLRRGDTMIQRATMHAWRNQSATKWARMVFCLQHCKPPIVNGKPLREDLSDGNGDIPASETGA